MPDADDLLFRTLADPTRRAIFERLCRDGEQQAYQGAQFGWRAFFDKLEATLGRID